MLSFDLLALTNELMELGVCVCVCVCVWNIVCRSIGILVPYVWSLACEWTDKSLAAFRIWCYIPTNLTCSMQNMYWCNKFFIKIKFNNGESTNRFMELQMFAMFCDFCSELLVLIRVLLWRNGIQVTSLISAPSGCRSAIWKGWRALF